MMNIVLDTNCLLMSLSRRSQYYPVWCVMLRMQFYVALAVPCCQDIPSHFFYGPQYL